MKTECTNYYCLDGRTGELFILGNHGDYEAASLTAEDMGLEPVWILTEEAAEQWRGALGNPEKRHPICFNFSLIDSNGNLYMGTSVDEPDPTIDSEFWQAFMTGDYTMEYCGYEVEA